MSFVSSALETYRPNRQALYTQSHSMQGIALHSVVYILYVALPLWYALWFWRGKARDKFDVAARLWGVPLYFVWAFVLAPWSWVSYYARYVLLALLVVSLVKGARLLLKLPFLKRKPVGQWLAKGAWGAAGVFFLALLIPPMIASEPVDPAVDLTFPLKGGTYHVIQGGASAGMNNHALVIPQRYALDLTRLGPWASRANHPFPTANTQFAIFAQPVFSPCSGHAIRVRDGLKDNAPLDFSAHKTLQDEDAAGNHVVIRCKGVDVLLAHFKAGTISIKEGHPVQEAEFIGKAGNSGNSSEPHLHIHAQKMSEDLSFWSERNPAVPIRFNDRFLRRNDLVHMTL